MPKIPEKCPSCESSLFISQMTCSQCGTQVSGHYEPNIFSRLAPTDLNFVVMFVQARGNVKEMERELGISYWTIRRKLDEIVEQLQADMADAAGQPYDGSARRATYRRRGRPP